MLNKLLRKDRNFDVKIVKKYLKLYYSKKSLYCYCMALLKTLGQTVGVQGSCVSNTFFYYTRLIQVHTQ